MVKHLQNDRGSFSVPLGMLFFILAVAALGILSVQRSWRGKMVIQLEIDRCVGLAAQNMRDTFHDLAVLNQAMIATRISLGTIGLLPQARVPLQAALVAETVAQEAIRAKWLVTSGQWLVERGCRPGKGDIPKPLPGLHLQRPLPDSLGSKPLEWEEDAPEQFTVWLGHPPRYAAATVAPKDESENNGDGENTEETSQHVGNELQNSLVPNLPITWAANWSDPAPFSGRFFSP